MYNQNADSLRARRTSIVRKAVAMSEMLKESLEKLQQMDQLRGLFVIERRAFKNSDEI